jgi:7-dehydrocholesterol reductase
MVEIKRHEGATDATSRVAAENWAGHKHAGQKQTLVQALANSHTVQMLVILFLMISSPPFCAAASFITNKLPNSSLSEISKFGVAEFFYEAFASGGFVGNLAAVKIVGAMFGAGLLFYYVPAREYSCSVTPTGHVPKYLDNGLFHLYGTTALYLGGISMGYWEGSVLFDHAHETVLFCNAFGLIFCLFLYFKGLVAPSCTESGSLGKGFINDYWHGTDQYPRLFGIDVKLMINCRFSMMYWFLMSISCIFASYKYNDYLDPAVLYCGALQAIYLWKFFKWESGYMNSIDIIVDRGGFMILWG